MAHQVEAEMPFIWVLGPSQGLYASEVCIYLFSKSENEFIFS